MITIAEYNMRSAVPVEGGERVTGYYCKRLMCGLKGPRQVDMIQVAVASDHLRWIEVDPSTIEPVRVRPIIETEDENGIPYEFIHYRCPNCRQIFTQECKGQKENLYRPKYHSECGMALDWSEPTRLDDLVEE